MRRSLLVPTYLVGLVLMLAACSPRTGKELPVSKIYTSSLYDVPLYIDSVVYLPLKGRGTQTLFYREGSCIKIAPIFIFWRNKFKTIEGWDPSPVLINWADENFSGQLSFFGWGKGVGVLTEKREIVPVQYGDKILQDTIVQLLTPQVWVVVQDLATQKKMTWEIDEELHKKITSDTTLDILAQGGRFDDPWRRYTLSSLRGLVEYSYQFVRTKYAPDIQEGYDHYFYNNGDSTLAFYKAFYEFQPRHLLRDFFKKMPQRVTYTTDTTLIGQGVEQLRSLHINQRSIQIGEEQFFEFLENVDSPLTILRDHSISFETPFYHHRLFTTFAPPEGLIRKKGHRILIVPKKHYEDSFENWITTERVLLDFKSRKGTTWELDEHPIFGQKVTFLGKHYDPRLKEKVYRYGVSRGRSKEAGGYKEKVYAIIQFEAHPDWGFTSFDYQTETGEVFRSFLQ